MNSTFGASADSTSVSNGFLPSLPPLARLPKQFDAWEDVAQRLPKVLCSDNVRLALTSLPPFPAELLSDGPELERAMALLSFVGHAYVWGESVASPVLPSVIAKPWAEVALRLGRPPVLSYSSYCLHNWALLDPTRQPETGSVALIQNFWGGIDEDWFVIIHVDIEMRAAPAIARLRQLQEAAEKRDYDTLGRDLAIVIESLEGMNRTLGRMGEWCDPYCYYHRVRPFIHGWKNHPDLPDGLLYEGVSRFNGKPQKFRGETGAQSAIVPCLDAVFGVAHAHDELREYLQEMRTYMPPDHRSFLESLEARPSIRDAVTKSGIAQLHDLYNRAVELLFDFRAKHLEYAASYIFKQGQTDSKNPHAVGTGGTPFMTYLKKHRDETLISKLSS